MELKLENGRYSAGRYHDLESVSGAEETAQRLMMRLNARRGGFALRPDYGSRLHTLASVKSSERESAARQFIAEALSGENAVLEALDIGESGSGIRLDIALRCGGESIAVSAVI